MPDKNRIFETIVRELSPDLLRYACWLCKDKSIADDLVQETFLRAWKSIDQLKDPLSVKSWLFTILKRENLRRFERKQFDLVDIEHTAVVDDGGKDFDELILQKQLHTAIKKLENKYKQPLLMQTIHGFKIEEIALILGLNFNTVNIRLFRAKNQLKEVMFKKSEFRVAAY